MQMRTFRIGLALAILSCVAAGAAAQTRPGVGYDPQPRAITLSRYQLDSLNSSYVSYQMDFTAHPDQVGANPNPYYIDLSDRAVRAAYEQRYGPQTAGEHFKRWQGPGNEVKFLLREALAWAYAKHPEYLGGDTSNRNGEPTEVEITDMQATNDRGIWLEYFESELDGYSADRRVTICDSKLPPGEGDYIEPFWGISYFYNNKYTPPPPFSPQLPENFNCR